MHTYQECLGADLLLEMVSIPSGEFMMGSPKGEPGRFVDEGPQHRVVVPGFYMGRYPVTQAQWRFVAGLPKVEEELNPNPAHFKGPNRPVEQVSWFEAMEFCTRLSVFAGREYRLPSEAEWEYACRAGTTTRFHFGDTITTEVANYDGSYPYSQTPKGTYREETTSVGEFPSNGYGLYDMHGNIWEWCLDHWHDSYQDAPKDGSPWLDTGYMAEIMARIVRGGSWFIDDWLCRSAYRHGHDPSASNDEIGFRVVAAKLP